MSLSHPNGPEQLDPV